MYIDASHIAQNAHLVTPDELVIVSGAGVSLEHPTHSPLGWELMKQAMTSYFLHGTLDDLQTAYSEMMTVTGLPAEAFKGRPRLEAVLDVVNRTHGPVALGHLTANFTNRPSNRVHRMLASHLAAGGKQATANFDRFIEHVCPTSATSPHHFHGEVESPSETLPFGARLESIEHGFEDVDRERLLSPLADPRTRVIAWVGYSFSDFFDATPALLDALAAGHLDDKTLIWFDHSDVDPAVQPLPAVHVPTVVMAAVERGVTMVRVLGRTGDALFELLGATGCPLDSSWSHEEPCDGSDKPPRTSYPASDDAKRAATARLLAQFGVLGRMSNLGLTITDLEHSDAAEYWWKLGEYEKARACALAALDIADPWLHVRTLLIHARCDWIEGRLVRAGRATLAAVRLLDADPSAPIELAAAALERFGRIAVHMRRVPDASLLALPILRAGLPDFEDRAAALLAKPHDVDGIVLAHLRDAAHNYRVEIRGHRTPVVDAETSRARSALIERFSQSESLDSYIDYIRGDANLGIWHFPRTGEDWQTQMARLYAIVGNQADVHRMTLFQPSPPKPGTRQNPVAAARALDASHWHRTRMVAKFWLSRLMQSSPKIWPFCTLR